MSDDLKVLGELRTTYKKNMEAVADAVSRADAPPSIADLADATNLSIVAVVNALGYAQGTGILDPSQIAASPYTGAHFCDGTGAHCSSTHPTLYPFVCADCRTEVGDCAFIAMHYNQPWSCRCGSSTVYSPLREAVFQFGPLPAEC